jgi:hypothetical protein
MTLSKIKVKRLDSETGEQQPAIKLTRAERKAIFGGDYTALKRDRKPDIKAGEKLYLAWSRGGKQFVGRTERERQENCGATIEIPRKPTVWIVFKQPNLKDGRWVVEFEAHDEREPIRLLAAPSGARRESGLKTRARKPEDVPKKGTETESWTPESERGYGGSGRSAIDELAAVDDATLNDFTRRVEEEGDLLRKKRRMDECKMQLEMRAAETRKRHMAGATAQIERQLEAPDAAPSADIV